ncbi:DUF2336 domain-containing protein [Parvularcula marina]|uniref:DUF2336 domain-containing protein n=1 Tax=Parvularcula marina TaxID=2292771 RepID=UPI003518B54A
MNAVAQDPDNSEEKKGRAPEIQRAELASRLVDVLSLPAGQMNENERAFTADILDQLFDHVPLKVKIDISTRLSRVLAPPALLLRRMLLEQIEVSTPLLKELKEITDVQLIEVAGVSVAHRQVIARRLKLNEAVIDSLLSYPDIEVVLHLLQRPDVRIGERRLDELVAMTEENYVLREPLLTRRELTPRHGFTMFWWLDRPARRKVLSRFAMDRSVLQDALKNLYCEVFPDPEPDPVTKGVLKLCDRRHRARGPNGETVSLEVVQKTFTNAFANPTPELCMAVGFMAGVSSETAKRILFDRGGEPFAVMCKSAGMSRSDFSDLLVRARLIRDPESRGPEVSEQDCEYLLGIFDMMARDYSRTALRYWDWRRGIQLDPLGD